MDSPNRREFPIGVFIAAAVVFVASFMPWFAVNYSSIYGVFFFDGRDLQQYLPTAWDSSISFIGITTPNWLVVAVAFAAAGLSWLKTAGLWTPPKSLLLGLPLYGLCHTTFTIFMLLNDSRISRLGMGGVLTFVSFAGMFVAVRKLLPQRKGAYVLPEDRMQYETLM